MRFIDIMFKSRKERTDRMELIESVFSFFLAAFVLNVCTKENNNNNICRLNKEKNGMPIRSKCFSMIRNKSRTYQIAPAPNCLRWRWCRHFGDHFCECLQHTHTRTRTYTMWLERKRSHIQNLILRFHFFLLEHAFWMRLLKLSFVFINEGLFKGMHNDHCVSTVV